MLPSTSRLRAILYPTTAVAVLLITWEMAVSSTIIDPIILPRFSTVLTELVNVVAEPFFRRSLVETLSSTLLGLAVGVVAGGVIGVASVSSALVRAAIMPYVVAIQNMPRIALAPLFLIWLGYGASSKVAMAAAICFFPVVMGVVVGLSVRPEQQDLLLSSLGASRVQKFRFLVAPAAMPYILAGIKNAGGLALTGAVVAEFVSSEAGLGFMIAQASFRFQIARMFAVLIVLAVVGTVIFGFLHLIDHRLNRWNFTHH